MLVLAHVQLSWLEDKMQLLRFFALLLSSGSPCFCVPIFLLLFWYFIVNQGCLALSPRVLINWDLKIQKITFNKLTMSRRKTKSPKRYAKKSKMGWLLVITLTCFHLRLNVINKIVCPAKFHSHTKKKIRDLLWRHFRISTFGQSDKK